MPVAVVDASAVAAILFGEPAADAVVERLDAHELVAPSLLRYEIASVAAGKARRREVSVDAAAEALATFSRLRIILHDLDPLPVFRLVAGTRLTAYDAAYLWLARVLSADLVTLDEKLARAWSRPVS